MWIRWKIKPQRARGEGYYDGASEDSLLHSFLSYNPASGFNLRNLSENSNRNQCFLLKQRLTTRWF